MTRFALAAVVAAAIHSVVFGQVGQAVLEKIRTALPEKALAQPKKPRRLLVYTRTLGFRHGSIPTGVAAIRLMGEKTGAYSIEHSEDPAMFDENRLNRFDAVLFLNTTGDCLAPRRGKLTEEERAQLERRKKNLLAFVKQGKGFAGIHSATDTFYSWKEYGEMIGAWFTNHPWGNVPIKVDSPNHPLTGMFNPKGFVYQDEIYQFAPRSRSSAYKGYQPYSRKKLRVLLSIDASRFKGKGARPDSDYAISWIRQYGKGRVFYCVLGHSNHTYWNPMVLRHYLAGLQYVLGDLPADATPSAAVETSSQLGAPAPEPINTLTKAERNAGWRLLFDGKSLKGWRRYRQKDTKGWTVKDGSIYLQKPGSGDLMTVDKFADFEFSIDWKFETGNNSGIIYRVAETKGPAWRTGPEMQVMAHNPGDRLGKTSGGSLYDMFAPTSNPFKGRDVWTRFKIVVVGKHIEHWVNGVKVVDCNIGDKRWNEHLAKSKWRRVPEFASQSIGHIALQDHGGRIYFRNIKIRPLRKE